MSTKSLFSALKSHPGNPYQKLILILMADISNDKDRCWPSHQYLSEMAGCSRSSVIRHLAELENKGYISVSRRVDVTGKKSSNVYTILDVSDRGGVVSERHKGSVTETHRGSVTETHNTPTLSILPSTQTTTAIHLDIGKRVSGWLEWVEYRKQARKPMTEATIKKQVTFLENRSRQEQLAIIEQSIKNGWTGLFDLKGKTNGQHHTTIETVYADTLHDYPG